MGTKLVRWAQKQRNLTAKQRYVLMGMCIIADDRHGKFYMNVHDFRSNLVPEIASHSSLRDHYAALCENGYVGRIRKGNGRKTHTSYQILAIDVLPQKAFAEYERASARRGDRRPHPIQGRLRTFERIDGGQSQDVGNAAQDVGAESDIP